MKSKKQIYQSNGADVLKIAGLVVINGTIITIAGLK